MLYKGFQFLLKISKRIDFINLYFTFCFFEWESHLFNFVQHGLFVEECVVSLKVKVVVHVSDRRTETVLILLMQGITAFTTSTPRSEWTLIRLCSILRLDILGITLVSKSGSQSECEWVRERVTCREISLVKNMNGQLGVMSSWFFF